MRLVLALAAACLAGCPLSQSAHCGEEYDRNLTRIRHGWYELAPTAADDPLAGVHAVRLDVDVAASSLALQTDDGRVARYHLY